MFITGKTIVVVPVCIEFDELNCVGFTIRIVFRGSGGEFVIGLTTCFRLCSSSSSFFESVMEINHIYYSFKDWHKIGKYIYYIVYYSFKDWQKLVNTCSDEFHQIDLLVIILAVAFCWAHIDVCVVTSRWQSVRVQFIVARVRACVWKWSFILQVFAG